MKKLLAILLSVLMLCTMIPFATVSAADEPTIEIVVEETELNAGDEFEVTVNLLNIPEPGLIYASVKLDWDESVMEIVTYYDEDEEDDFNKIEVGSKYNTSTNKYMSFGPLGTCNVTYSRPTAKETQVRYEEHFFTATFKIKDDAVSGDYTIGMKDYNPKNFVRFGNLATDFAIQGTTITVNGRDPEPVCQHEYTYACDKTCAKCGELTNEAAEHNVVHVDAAAATCDAPGNVEYWYCDICGAAWLDAECTLVTNMMSVITPIAHNVIHVEAKDATCDEPGNIEYWYCDICGQAWLDEYCHLNTNLNAVILPIAHNVIHVEAKDATCTEMGNIEYWYCDICGAAWLDEYCHLNTNLMAVKLPMAEHTYDDDMDADCNDCGDIRLVKYEVKTFSENSIAETNDGLSGLAFRYDLTDKISGLAIVEGTKYVADYSSAYVTPDSTGTYKLVKMGAEVFNGSYSTDVPIKKIVLEENGSCWYAIRIINIPENQLSTMITVTPYFVYEDAEGQQIVVELDPNTACAADYMN